ncbi:MAG: sigma-70 family RNA polymerase sigma factor [Lachnospiraceae bacterium]|nr:sigma-70 family RNA polymerase sigma factor [Lachnospiraceae bacterium]
MPDFNHSYIGGLVLLAQENDSDAFAELYALTYKHIYNYAGHYLRDAYLAQDAVQETYISALKNIKNIKDPSLFVAWINQICFHVCYDMSKKGEKGSEVSSEFMELLHDELTDHNPEAQIEVGNEIKAVKLAVAKLPFNEQQVIVMRYYNEMKLEEIADALQISRSSVKRYLQAGKDRLETILRKEGFQ